MPETEVRVPEGLRLFGFSPTSWIAIAIAVGIIAVVAIPSDALYVPRSKMKEVVATAHACSSQVAAFMANQRRVPRDAREAGCSDAPTAHTTRTEVNGSLVKVTIRDVHRNFDGKFLSLRAFDEAGRPATEAGPVARWLCATDADPNDVLTRILPQECRNPPE